jgi:hypothetical protein
MTTLDRTPATPSPAAAPRDHVRGLSRIAVIVLLALPIASACAQSTPDPVVARVNGVEIKESDLSIAEDDLGNELRAATPDAKREQLIAYVADIILVAKAAEAKKVQDANEFKQRPRVPAQQAPDGPPAADRSKGCDHRGSGAQALRRGGEARRRRDRNPRAPHPVPCRQCE